MAPSDFTSTEICNCNFTGCNHTQRIVFRSHTKIVEVPVNHKQIKKLESEIRMLRAENMRLRTRFKK